MEDSSKTVPRSLPAIPQQDKKFKYTLTLEELEKSSNPNQYVVELKEKGWINVESGNNGDQFEIDINRMTSVNNQPLRSNQIEEYAKQYPLIRNYALVHNQKPMFLYYNAISKNISKAQFSKGFFSIIYKNDSTNVEINKTSACLETNNNMLFIMNPSNPASGKLFSIPGHIQTVSEMVGQYNLQLMCAENPFPSDKDIQKNPKKLYLYLNKSGLLEYAVFNQKNKVQRIVISDSELGEANKQCIKDTLEKKASAQAFDSEKNVAALSVFYKITSAAGFHIAGLKLKAISASNKVLLDLMSTDFKEFNEKMLEELVNQAKQEEPRESLYEWYKEQAKVFFSAKFFQSYDGILEFGCNAFRQEFLVEVNLFLSEEKEPTSIFEEMISGVESFWKGLANLVEPLPQKTVRSLPSPGYGRLHSTIDCSEKHKFIFSLYLHIKGEENNEELPTPVPEVSLNGTDGLSITIDKDAKKFISIFKAYNSQLFNRVFNSTDQKGNSVAVFNNRGELKEFLLACNMPISDINVVVPNLYNALYKENKPDDKKVPNLNAQPPKFMGPTRSLPLPQNHKPKDAMLVNTVRSYPGSNLLAVCTASQIDIFARVAYSFFTEQKYQNGKLLPRITLNAENGYISIAYNSHESKVLKHPGELKESFSKYEGFEKVDMEKLSQELCIKQNLNYEDISKKWESNKSFLSSYSFGF